MQVMLWYRVRVVGLLVRSHSSEHFLRVSSLIKDDSHSWVVSRRPSWSNYRDNVENWAVSEVLEDQEAIGL